MDKKFKRKCIICSMYKEKSELIRITKVKNENEIIVNTGNNIQGYSYYICKDENCIKKALNTKVLNKITKSKVCFELTEKLKQIINFEKN